MLVLFLLEPFALIMLNKICVKFSKHYIFRVIGVHFYSKKPFSGLRNALTRLFMESYLEICMCTFLNVMAFSQAKNLSELIEYFSTIDDLLCSMLTCLTFILILIFPFWAAMSIKNNFGSLDSKKTRQLYGPLYEDIKTNSLNCALYQVFFVARRLIITVLFVLFNNFTFTQSMVMIGLSWAVLAYTSHFHPFTSVAQNRIELFNEFCVFLCCHTINSFLNAGVPDMFRDVMGWVLIGIAGINISTNIIILGYQTSIDLILTIYSYIHE